ncbi:MAG: hypothetical protein RKO66_17555 [Candidatus Contendobacter sp.]|nr:hypothetical protein [Candidatus Contendobacter sp.]MDS4057663.1 hypothetical protein [Candidatus Contendobacter sp.]
MAQPTENLRIAPEDGFLPHFTEAFVSYYDDHWSYIYAVADLLTDNFKQVLVSAGKATAESEFACFGDPSARDTLRALVKKLEQAGIEKPILHLLQEATGRRTPGAFAATVDSILGPSVFARWLTLVDGGNFTAANQLTHNSQ